MGNFVVWNPFKYSWILHGGKLNRKLIRLDFEATQGVFRFETDFLGGSTKLFL